MSAINETTEMWREVHQDQAEHRRITKETNLAILRASTIPFQFRNDGDVVLVREKGYPIVDFWPSKNKWSIGGRMMHGTAHELLNFLWLRGPKRGKVAR